MKKNKSDVLIISILLGFYMSFCTCFEIWTLSTFLTFIILGVFYSGFLYIILNKFLYFNIDNHKQNFRKREFVLYSFIVIFMLIVSLFVYRTSGCIFTDDSMNQFKQAITNNYNNWHPVGHTFIFFKIPTLFYDSVLSCVLFQFLFITVCLNYFCYFLRKNYLSKKWTVIILILFLINPLNLLYANTLWKDIPYSYSLFILTLFLIEIYKSNGKWLNKKSNIFGLILILLQILFFRHNGIAIVIIVSMFLIIFYSKKYKVLLATFLVPIGIYFVVNGPVYDYLDIPDHEFKHAELFGVPLSQVSYIYNNNGILSDSMLEFMNNLSPLENWKKYYNKESFNDIKWSNGYNMLYLEENYKEFFKLYIESVKNNFLLSYQGYVYITNPVWNFNSNGYVEYGGETTSWDIINNISTFGRTLFRDYYNNINKTVLKWLIPNFALGLFIIIFALGLTILKKKLNFESYIPFIPVFINVAMIMCLITGWEQRFVYSSILCCYPLIIFALLEKKNDNKANDNSLFTNLFLKETNNTLIQFFRYLFVGGFSAVVNIGFLYIFKELFTFNLILSNILSFILGLITNYILSKKFVFQEKTGINKYKEFTIYAVIGIFGLLFDTFILWFLTESVNIYYMVSKIISTFLVFIWNFIARKFMYLFVKEGVNIKNVKEVKRKK